MFRQTSYCAASLAMVGGIGIAAIANPVAGAALLPLNGWTPDVVDTNGATWSAGSYLQVGNGEASISSAVGGGSGTYNAYLPFNPTSGQLYTLTVTLNPTADWLAFGFAAGRSVSSSSWPSANNAGPWMLSRSNGGGVQWTGLLGAQSFSNSSSSPTGPTTYSMTLNTNAGTNESNYSWTTTLSQGSTELGSALFAETSGYQLAAIGLGQDGQFSLGNWRNLILTDKNLSTNTTTVIYNDSFGAPVPAPNSLAVIGLGALGALLLCSRRRPAAAGSR